MFSLLILLKGPANPYLQFITCWELIENVWKKIENVGKMVRNVWICVGTKKIWFPNVWDVFEFVWKSNKM